MQYGYYFGMMKRHESQRIKICLDNDEAAVAEIPSAFALLFDDIFATLQKQLHRLCANDEMLVISGLKPTLIKPRSSFPVLTRRTLDQCDVDEHFTCELTYKVLQHTDNPQLMLSQQRNVSIIIDFVTGVIMDSQAYAAYLSSKQKQNMQGYGKILERSLRIAWGIIKAKRLASLDNNNGILDGELETAWL